MDGEVGGAEGQSENGDGVTNKEGPKMAIVKLYRKGCRLEDREMEGYAMLYRAYLARRHLPGPVPTFADFVEIRKMQERLSGATPEEMLQSNGFIPETSGLARSLAR
jgi:hypothetical protein